MCIRDRSKAACDQFGHQQLSGAGKALEFIVKENIGVKVRSVEVNVLQRCASHLASLTDIEESFAQGKKGVTIAAAVSYTHLDVYKRQAIWYALTPLLFATSMNVLA